MRPDCQTARSYLVIDGLVQSIERRLGSVALDCCGYSGAAIGRRIAQSLAMRITDPLLRQSIQLPAAGISFAANGSLAKLDAEGIQMTPASGMVRPSVKIFCSELGKFFALWLLVLAYWLRSFVVGQTGTGKATLLHGVPEADLHTSGSAHRFEEFCQFGQLKILSTAERLIVQSTRQVTSTRAKRFIYIRMPLLHLFLLNSMTKGDSIRFLTSHFGVLFKYLNLLRCLPIASLLWRDFALHSVAESLNRRKLIEKNVITNTNWLQQFLWMTDLPNRSFSTEMIMYSLNSSGLVFKDDPVPANHPSIRHLRADLIYIWDESYRDILAKEKIFCKTAIVPPVLWYLPPVDPPERQLRLRRVCVFDVSPSSSQALRNRGLLGHYYSASTMGLFLDDLLFASNEASRALSCEVEIVLKHKRTPTPVHDREYFKYVKYLCASNDNLHLAAEDANLYSLIGESDIVVVIPYSSPAYIARYLKVPAVFYDPTGDILPSNIDPEIQFCAGRSELTETLIRYFRD